MQTFEFEVDAVDDLVRIPQQYTGLFNKHIKFIAMVNETDAVVNTENKSELIAPMYTDEYIKDNWRQLLSIGLSQRDDNHYRSEQYADEKGAYLSEKNK